MSEQLLEQNFMTFDLRTLGRLEPEAEETEEAVAEATEDSNEKGIPEAANEEEASAELESLPGKGEWDEWKKLLAARKEANDALSATEKKTQYEVESKFFREFFTENWGHEIGERLVLIGDPLTKAIKVLGFNPAKNPILGFIRQKRVVTSLIATKKLNVETFKAIYNAVANNLVAHSEFIKEKPKNEEYNIIYCLDLYNKPVKEMLDYLRLQSQILEVSRTEYTAEDQLKNKRAFLDVGEKITEQEEHKRAAKINELSLDQLPILASAKLNTLTLAREVSNKVGSPTTKLDGKGQDALVAKLVTPADKYAALLALSIATQNAKAQEALSDNYFAGLSSDVKLKAVMTLSAKGIMPKGQLNETDANALVAKIMASLHKEN
jgi:hypothetical protein